MEKYICENVYVPLRYGPSHKSEMMSQILFGEKYILLEKSGSWLKIKTEFDQYSGWIDNDHLQQSPDEENQTGQVLNRTLLCFKNDKTKLVLEAGCEVFRPNFDDKTFLIGKNTYTTSIDFSNNYLTVNGSLAETAMKYINSPYIWGGRTPSGIDCSGFTQLVFKIHGIPIPRDSRAQAEVGSIINFIDEAEPGDLVFFDNEIGRICHVGMILSRGLVIHASGRIRIDNIDHQGIYKQEKRDYSHHLRTIKRIS